MPEKWKTWIKNKNNFVVAVLIGVLLLVMLIPVKSKDTAEENETEFPATVKSQSESDVNLGQDLDETQAYCQMLEERLSLLLSKIEGVGKTQVMITMQYSQERVVETEKTLQTQETTETDSGGGSRVVSSVEEKNSTVYESTSNNSIPYVIKTQLPKVQGVMVVAEGAGTGEMDLKITQAVQALLGIEVHKIAVAKMEAQ